MQINSQHRNGAVAAAPVTPAKPRLSLARVSKGRQTHPVWIHVYGPEGVGKSSLGAATPSPIFIDVEQGTFELETTRFQFDESGRTMPRDFEELLEAVRVIEREEHPYKTLVIDTLDAVEALVWQHICARDGKANVSDYGYGKGENIVALDEWRKLVAALERVRAKGVNVITLSHSIVKRFDDPEGEGYDRHVLKLHEKAGGLIKERADAVLFAKFETVKKKDKDGRKVRAITTDARFLYTHKTGAFDAKNRCDLPFELPLDWNELWSAIQAHQPADPSALISAIKAAAEKLGGATKETALRYLADAGEDAVKLSKIHNWCNAKLIEHGLAGEEN